MPTKRRAPAAPKSKPVHQPLLDRIMPRHAPFYIGFGAGLLALAISLWLVPTFAVPIAANALFIAYLAVGYFKLPILTADYLRDHAKDEDAPSGGLFLLVFIVIAASVGSLFLALGDSEPDVIEVALCIASVLLGWFTVQAVGAFHYAYEYYQAPEEGKKQRGGVAGGLDFPGDDEPDGSAFMYFSYTIGTSVATSDTKVTSNAMRRRVIFHVVFAHLYNTIILAAAVNVMLTLGGAS
ncbi:MAG: DUF1345 domain-containing protein [Phyllobacteriaceae bacterium]|nr:DUF1345 domain-containing protein [Phyllobacteriaceae bacterium]